MQSLYFYEFPHPTNHFFETLLPTLQHFFPLAANLVCPPPPAMPHILFTEGDSSVPLTIVDSAANFHSLSANHPQPVRALPRFVPELPPTRVGGVARVSPLLALQVTVFPNAGICLVWFNHAAADGREFHHFMKSRALVCKTGGDLTRLDSDLQLPSHDRTAIKDPDGLDRVLLDTWRCLASSTCNDREDVEPVVLLDSHADNVRATLVLRCVTNQLASDENSRPFYISTFVVACALIWVSLAKSEEITEKNSSVDDDDGPNYYYFGFVAGLSKPSRVSITSDRLWKLLDWVFRTGEEEGVVGRKWDRRGCEGHSEGS
ncbi:Anthocyanin 5-aromatic acyltransferase [Morus notabilis]|uniref:Anthocyanin 5-aromatic acyltransferase n=1 Tax=Morus notabilis TaxID=981085 RepID=W9R0B0_9ROSA|nr:coumaroyl-CoA:anthocyanidin 3-O-glucoside-6''-O-coumaroyltransferase 1 [Morus notabilis]EXB62316.1 Anthocyanin 5-aromatic acyltransferase [Morus notabilis]